MRQRLYNDENKIFWGALQVHKDTTITTLWDKEIL